MATLFSINIKTPQKTVFEGSAQSVIAPGEFGYVGILANHAPFITTLVPGKITLRDGSGVTSIFKSAGKGLLEIFNNNATLLMDSIEAQS